MILLLCFEHLSVKMKLLCIWFQTFQPVWSHPSIALLIISSCYIWCFYLRVHFQWIPLELIMNVLKCNLVMYKLWRCGRSVKGKAIFSVRGWKCRYLTSELYKLNNSSQFPADLFYSSPPPAHRMPDTLWNICLCLCVIWGNPTVLMGLIRALFYVNLFCFVIYLFPFFFNFVVFILYFVYYDVLFLYFVLLFCCFVLF